LDQPPGSAAASSTTIPRGGSMKQRQFRQWAILVRAAVAGALTLTFTACSNSTAPAGSSLVVYGTADAAAAYTSTSVAASHDDMGPEWEHGAAGSLTIRLYALYISPNADCSAPVLVQQLGSAGEDKDFIQNPVLFEGTPPSGTYPCVMFRMSDVLRMKPASTFGACVTGAEYSGDIYRDGETDWKDPFLNPIIGSGTDEVPVDDRVTIFMTRNPEAAMARGISSNQLVPLISDLIVPGQSAINLDASQSVVTNGVECGLNPPVISFR
jgi:hypothetical protein